MSDHNTFMQPVQLDTNWIKLGDSSDDRAPLICNVRRSGMVIGRVVDQRKGSPPGYVAEVFQRGEWKSIGVLSSAERAAEAVGRARAV